MQMFAQGKLSFIDMTDTGNIQMYITSNHPASVVHDPNNADLPYTPDWSVNHLSLTPVVRFDEEEVSLDDKSLAVTWKRQFGSGIIESIGDGESVTNGVLQVSENQFALTSSGTITYLCTAAYTDELTERTVETQGQITFTLIRNATELKNCIITGDQTFKYNGDGTLVSSDTITLSGTALNVSIREWQYRNINGEYVRYPESLITPTLTVKSTDDVFVNDVAMIRLTTSDESIFDLHQIVKLRDGAPGIDTYSCILSNDTQSVPCNSNGELYETSLNGCDTVVSIYHGGVDDTANWEVVAKPSPGITGSYDPASRRFTVTGITVDSGYVEFSATKKDCSPVSKRFSINKDRSGSDGADAVFYKISPDTVVIRRDTNDVLIPNQCVFSVSKKIADKDAEPYMGRIKVYESSNGTTFVSKYTSGSDESSHTYTPSNPMISALKCELYASGGTSTLLDSQTVLILSDGEMGIPGEDAINAVIGNSSEIIPCDMNGNVLSNKDINIPFGCYKGTNRISGSAAISTLPSGFTLKSNTPATTESDGAIVLSVKAGSDLSGQVSGDITITISIEKEKSTHKFTWTKNMRPEPGQDATLLQIFAPNGDVIINGANSVTIQASLTVGSSVISSGVQYKWLQYTDSGYLDIPGATDSTLVVSPDMVASVTTFQCIATYKNESYIAYYSVSDKNDPVELDVICNLGDKLINSQGIGVVYAMAFRNGEEIDPIRSTTFSLEPPTNPKVGDFYYYLDSSKKEAILLKYDGQGWMAATGYDLPQGTYIWTRRDELGNELDIEEPYATGKVLYLDSTIVDAKTTFRCKFIMDDAAAYGENTVVDISEPITVILSNEVQQFSTNVDRVPSENKVAFTDILVYQGTTRTTDFVIGDIPSSDGITVTKTDSRVNFAVLTTTPLLADSGTFTIPITVGVQTINKTFSWSCAKQGADGGAAKSVNITSSSLMFKSVDGGIIFKPDAITLTPRFQGGLTFLKWQYSADAGVSWLDVVSGENDLTVSDSGELVVSKNCDLYTDEIGALSFKCFSNDETYYDVVTIIRLYDTSDIQIGGRNLAKWTSVPFVHVGTNEEGSCSDLYQLVVNWQELAGETVSLSFDYAFDIDSTANNVEVGLNAEPLTKWITLNPSEGLSGHASETFVIPDDVGSGDKLSICFTSFVGRLVITNLKLERGNVPTDWTPAPEDLDNQVTEVKNSVTELIATVDTVNNQIKNKIWRADAIEVTDSNGNIVEKGLFEALTESTQDLYGFTQKAAEMFAGKNEITEIKQTADKISWLITSGSTESSLEMTAHLLEAIIKQVKFTSPDGSSTVIEGGKILANSITTEMLTSDIIKSSNYSNRYDDIFSDSGTYFDLSTGAIYSENFGIDDYGNAYFNGVINAYSGGSIADFTISDSSLYTGSKSYFESTAHGVYVGDDGISLGDSFSVDSDGNATMTEGHIGEWLINSKGLFYKKIEDMACSPEGIYDGRTQVEVFLRPGDFYTETTSGGVERLAGNAIFMTRLLPMESDGTLIENDRLGALIEPDGSFAFGAYWRSMGNLKFHPVGVYGDSGEFEINCASTLIGGTIKLTGYTSNRNKPMGVVSSDGTFGTLTLDTSDISGLSSALSGKAPTSHKHWYLYYEDTGALVVKTYYDDKTGNHGFVPQVDSRYVLGTPSQSWSKVFVNGSNIASSDGRLKTLINDIDPRYEQAFMRLRPVTYMMRNIGSRLNHDRIHCGFIAQEVNDAAEKSGLTSENFAFICHDNLDEEVNGLKDKWGLAYGELHGLEVHMIQKAFKRLDTLEKENSLLKSKLNELMLKTD